MRDAAPRPVTSLSKGGRGASEHFAAGRELARKALSGNWEQAAGAEAHLLRSHELHPTRSSARVLARLLNHRSVDYDFSRAELQGQLYEELLRDDSWSYAQRVHFDCARKMATAQRAAAQGRWVDALAQVQEVETEVEAALREAQQAAGAADAAALHALAGTYALALAELYPGGQRLRWRRAGQHFDALWENWERLPAHARNENQAPNVKAVFGLQRAEAYRKAGAHRLAVRAYEDLLEAGPELPATQTRTRILAYAQEQASSMSERSSAQTPLWPQGREACEACHDARPDLAGA